MWLPSLGLLALPESGQTGPGDSSWMSTHPHPCPSNHHHMLPAPASASPATAK